MQNLLKALMESPIYWMMTIRQRLALIRRINYKNDYPSSHFRQRALVWVKTGSLEEGDTR